MRGCNLLIGLPRLLHLLGSWLPVAFYRGMMHDFSAMYYTTL